MYLIFTSILTDFISEVSCSSFISSTLILLSALQDEGKAPDAGGGARISVGRKLALEKQQIAGLRLDVPFP